MFGSFLFFKHTNVFLAVFTLLMNPLKELLNSDVIFGFHFLVSISANIPYLFMHIVKFFY